MPCHRLKGNADGHSKNGVWNPNKTSEKVTKYVHKAKISEPFKARRLVGEGGFEPPKSLTTDLQSAPFGHSGIPPYEIGAGRRTRTPDLLITNPAHEVKCLILRAFRAFSLHTSMLNQQVLSGVSIRSYRPVGQRVGQRVSQVHVSRTRENRAFSVFSPSILRRQTTALCCCNTCITTTKAEKGKLKGGLHLPPAQSTG